MTKVKSVEREAREMSRDQPFMTHGTEDIVIHRGDSSGVSFGPKVR